ncbi:hypothetical protein ILUMI_05281 [Ignelater luminosus]|uniref:Cytochrome c oxidase assembly protein COX16 homolog, mitochondrial n=1 Tax=Ignelater luminosus TaxID=2038154 RepID=A0A8K0DCK4_IGNLU|nr:hypothetical protein ILUMI_05281 [Ignelater luminosus]
MERLSLNVKTFTRRRSVKYGIPIFVIVVGGSFYLEQFSKLKYQFGRQQSAVNPAELKKEGIEVKDRKELTLEAQYEEIKKLDIDNWEQVRGPRPWEPETLKSSS